MNEEGGKTRSGSEARQRGAIIGFRATPAERAEIEAAAERAGLSLGSYIRASVLAAPETRATRRPTIERELMAQATAQLGRISGNLHQIAKRLNFGDIEFARDIPEAVEQLRQAIALLMQAAGRQPRDKSQERAA
jgi:hypothetical protein